VTISPGLAAELALLTQALDLPGTEVADTLTRLAADAQSAIGSYLGLSVVITANGSEFDFTILRDATHSDHVRTSLLIPLTTAAATANSTPASVALILYAATPGAFIDLAADLSWITGRVPANFRIDEHCALPASYTDPTAMTAMSSINQALGVLIGRGSTPERAERDLYERAAAAGIELVAAATLVLAALVPPEAEPEWS
jgi:hypothetical protein